MVQAFKIGRAGKHGRIGGRVDRQGLRRRRRAKPALPAVKSGNRDALGDMFARMPFEKVLTRLFENVIPDDDDAGVCHGTRENHEHRNGRWSESIASPREACRSPTSVAQNEYARPTRRCSGGRHLQGVAGKQRPARSPSAHLTIEAEPTDNPRMPVIAIIRRRRAHLAREAHARRKTAT